jgi:hypothetical protein
VIDQAEELNSNEVKVSGKHAENGLVVVGVWHVEANGMLQWESTQNGKPIIRDGVFLSTNYKMPFLNRCGD